MTVLPINTILTGDALAMLRMLPDCCADCCVTSPPYFGLRDYGIAGQIGLEETPEAYVERLRSIFMEVHRVLKPEGTLWLIIGDSYWGGKGYSNNVAGQYQDERRKAGKSITAAYANIGGKGAIRPTDRHHELIKPKDLIGIPWMVAFALRNSGWYLRQNIIWEKLNPLPESVTDRCTKSHEDIFLFSKEKKYYYNCEAIMEPAAYDGRKDTRMKGSHKYSQEMTGLRPQTFAARGHERWVVKNGRYMRNKRDVWTVNTKSYHAAHFATFPPELIVPCIKAGCPEGGVVLDPFMGAGTTALVARKLNRNYIGVELNPAYVALANKRLINELGLFL
jgi:DNA modification methylase